MKKLVLLILMLPGIVGATCTQALTGLGLCYPNYNDTGPQLVSAIRSNFVILNSSVPVAASTPTYSSLFVTNWITAGSSITARNNFYGTLVGSSTLDVQKTGGSMTGGLSINGTGFSTGLEVFNQKTSASNTGANIQAIGAGATQNIALWLEADQATKNTALYISSPAAGANNYAIDSHSLAQSRFLGSLTASALYGDGTTLTGVATSAQLTSTATALTSEISRATTRENAIAVSTGIINSQVAANTAALSTAAYINVANVFTAANTISNSLTVTSLTVTSSQFKVDGSTFNIVSGRVGIGTTNPSNGKLQIDGVEANYQGIDIKGSNVTGKSYGAYIHAGTDGTDSALEVRNQAAATPAMFKVQGDGAVKINSDLTIGTSLTSASSTVTGAMQVNGVSRFKDQILVGTVTAGGWARMLIDAPYYATYISFSKNQALSSSMGVDHTGSYLLSGGAAGDFGILNYDSGNIALANASGVPVLYTKGSTGRVGIGTIIPAQKLEVTGNILASSSTVMVTGNAGGILITPAVTSAYAGQVSNYSNTNAANGLLVSNVYNTSATRALTVKGNSATPLVSGDDLLYVRGDGYTAVPLGEYAVGVASFVVTAGKVGIGTASPDTQFTLRTNNRNTAVARIGSVDGSYDRGITVWTADDPRPANVLTWRPTLDLAIGDTGGYSYAGKMRFNMSATGAAGKTSTTMKLSALSNLDSYATESDIMTWQGAGNVGIGTASPGAALDVNGTVRINAGTVSVPAITFRAATTTGIFLTDDGVGPSIQYTISGNNLFTMYRNGNFGIGISTPATVLDVNTLGSAYGVRIADLGSRGLELLPQSTNGAFRFQSYDRTAAAFSGMLFATTANKNEMFISSGGFVGIGTNAPAQKFSVYGGNVLLDAAGGGGSLILNNGLFDLGNYGLILGGAAYSSGFPTGNTRKMGQIESPHYSAGASSITILYQDNDSASSTLFLGGGNGYRNASTEVAIWTAGNITTAAGTKRFSINASGNIISGAENFKSTFTYATGSLDLSGNAGLKTYTETKSSAAVSATYNVAWSSGSVYWLSLDDNTTLTFSQAVEGQSINLFVKQNVGGKAITWPTISWPSATAPTLTASAGKVDIISIFYTGGVYYGFVGGKNY